VLVRVVMVMLVWVVMVVMLVVLSVMGSFTLPACHNKSRYLSPSLSQYAAGYLSTVRNRVISQTDADLSAWRSASIPRQLRRDFRWTNIFSMYFDVPLSL
jgi:hypothetical protein